MLPMPHATTKDSSIAFSDTWTQAGIGESGQNQEEPKLNQHAVTQ